MTKRDQMIECMAAMEDGMCQTAQNSDIWQNRLISALCKAVYLLLEDRVKTRHGKWLRTPISGTLYCSACDTIPHEQKETVRCPCCNAVMDL